MWTDQIEKVREIIGYKKEIRDSDFLITQRNQSIRTQNLKGSTKGKETHHRDKKGKPNGKRIPVESPKLIDIGRKRFSLSNKNKTGPIVGHLNISSFSYISFLII